MKKLSFFAMALAAIAFAACGGSNKPAEEATAEDSLKAFEQAQIEENIKVQIDSIASEINKLPALSMFVESEDGSIALTEAEKQVKPDYLLEPKQAEETVTLSSKYRVLTVLQIDKVIANAYDMPIDEYENAIIKLTADINDPAFAVLNEDGTFAAVTQKYYDAEEENGRINYFWQVATTSIVEQLYILTQNTDKYITNIDDEAAANLTLRLAIVQDAIDRLTEYDPELIPVSEAIAPLNKLNAISQAELKAELTELKPEIEAARAQLVK